MSYLDILRHQLHEDEGRKSKPYKCTAGKTSIGVGRNLDDKGLKPDEIDYLLGNDIKDAEADARLLFPTFETLSDNRKAVLANMSFQLGRNRLRNFMRFREAVTQGDFERAAKEMADSAWNVQVPNRAARLIKMMRDG